MIGRGPSNVPTIAFCCLNWTVTTFSEMPRRKNVRSGVKCCSGAFSIRMLGGKRWRALLRTRMGIEWFLDVGKVGSKNIDRGP